MDKKSADKPILRKAVKIGNSHYVSLPKKVIEEMGIKKGDWLAITSDAYKLSVTKV